MPAESRVPQIHESEAALRVAAERAYAYVREANDRRVAPSADAVAALANFHEPFPEHGSAPAEIVAMLDRWGSPATVATTGGRYFGFVIGGTLPTALGASCLANAWDQNAAYRVMSPQRNSKMWFYSG